MPARVSQFALTAVLVGLAAALPNYVPPPSYTPPAYQPPAYGYYPTGTGAPAPTDYPAPPPEYNGPPVTYTGYQTSTHTYTLTTSVPCSPYTVEGVVYSMTPTITTYEACETAPSVLTMGCDQYGCYGGAPEPTSYDVQYPPKTSNPHDDNWVYEQHDKCWHYRPVGQHYKFGHYHNGDYVYTTQDVDVTSYFKTEDYDITEVDHKHDHGYDHSHDHGSGYVVTTENDTDCDDTTDVDHSHDHGYVAPIDHSHDHGYVSPVDHSYGSGYVSTPPTTPSYDSSSPSYGHGNGYVAPVDTSNPGYGAPAPPPAQETPCTTETPYVAPPTATPYAAPPAAPYAASPANTY